VELAVSLAIDATAVHPTSGGAGRYLRELTAHLMAPMTGEHLDPPTVLLRRSDTTSWPSDARLHRIAPNARPVRLFWEQTMLLKRLMELAPGTTVLHSPHYTMPYRRSGPRPARVVTVHDATFFTRPDDHQPSKRVLFRHATRHALQQADAVIVPTHAVAETLRAHVNIGVPVHVIHHGVDRARFRPRGHDTDADDLARLDRLGVARPYIFHVGAIEPRKNIDVLCRAVDHATATGQWAEQPVLALAGAPWRGELERLPPMQHARRIILGFVDEQDLPALLRQASVVAYPSSEEGFGLPVAEALACGAPVVTTDRGATAEVAGGAARLVPARNIEALADALVQAAEHGTNGLPEPHIATWDDCARAHLDVYRSVGL
jgi:glycosyltransferase involved in cell wall biosynthesis